MARLGLSGAGKRRTKYLTLGTLDKTRAGCLHMLNMFHSTPDAHTLRSYLPGPMSTSTPAGIVSPEAPSLSAPFLAFVVLP